MLVSREISDIDNDKRIRLQLVSRQGVQVLIITNRTCISVPCQTLMIVVLLL